MEWVIGWGRSVQEDKDTHGTPSERDRTSLSHSLSATQRAQGLSLPEAKPVCVRPPGHLSHSREAINNQT